MIRAIIIDDEYDGRESLEQALGEYCPEVQIVAVCEGPEQGIVAIQDFKPDLVFLDIQMPRMSGFDVLQQLSPIYFQVIFVTSYDRYAIKAIKFSALDYLLKPVDVDELIGAVSKVKNQLSSPGNAHHYQSVINNIQYTSGKIDKLAIPTFEGIDFYNTEDIIYCQAEGNYTTLFMLLNKKEVVSRNLKDFENLLTGSGFCRVHKSYLINMKHIHKYVRGDGGYVVLSEDHHVDISRRRKEAFLRRFEKI
ncbi:MAG: LytR/AlgR family response regulator transcription factor [Flavobacteriaceae bacterium]